jgi:hypothetical protein
MGTPEARRYLFKVNLKTAKSIWRTIALRGDHTLDDLHEMIFTAFERYDDHMYSFYFPRGPSRRDAGFRPTEYTSPMIFEEPDAFRDEEVLDASEAELGSLDLEIGQTFEYLFDFGDSWWHQIKVLGIDVADKSTANGLPVIVECQGEAPAQYPTQDV